MNMKLGIQIAKSWTMLALILGIIPGIMSVNADEASIRQNVARLLPGTVLDQVEVSPIAGLYEVTIGPSILYVSADGRYLIKGDILDLNTHEDLTEAKQAKAKQAVLAKIPESQMVIFSPPQPKHTITVFTDLDCGYCRRLHQEIGSFMQEGIKVRYLFFPRAGINSPSYDKAVSVWCSKDRQQALTDAKAGKDIPKLTCNNPVSEQMHLGELMGVTGTPSIILEDGRFIPGYVPAAKMAEYFNNTTPK